MSSTIFFDQVFTPRIKFRYKNQFTFIQSKIDYSVLFSPTFPSNKHFHIMQLFFLKRTE